MIIEKIFLKVISLLNYSMKNLEKSDLTSPKYFLQMFIPLMLFLKFIYPNFHSDDAFTMGIIMMPILFVVVGYVYNKLYEFHRSTKV